MSIYNLNHILSHFLLARDIEGKNGSNTSLGSHVVKSNQSKLFSILIPSVSLAFSPTIDPFTISASVFALEIHSRIVLPGTSEEIRLKE